MPTRPTVVRFATDAGAHTTTIVITTAPQPSIPSTKVLAATLGSIARDPQLAVLPVIIVCDGCPLPVGTALQHLDPKCRTAFDCDAYRSYVETVRLTASEALPDAASVLVLELEHRGCLSSALYTGIQHVKTPLVLVVQQDLAFVRPVPLARLEAVLLQPESPVQHVQLRKEYGNMETTVYSMNLCGITGGALDILSAPPDSAVEVDADLPKLWPSTFWSDNNHLATMEHYRTVVWPEVPGGTFMEHVIGCKPVTDPAAMVVHSFGLPFNNTLEPYLKHLDGRVTV